MGKLKVIVKRPLNHYLIIIIYILAPVINVLMVRILGQIPFHLVIRNFFEGFGLLAGLWLITAPIIGIGFYFVNRVSWYAFIGHSFLIADAHERLLGYVVADERPARVTIREDAGRRRDSPSKKAN